MSKLERCVKLAINKGVDDVLSKAREYSFKSAVIVGVDMNNTIHTLVSDGGSRLNTIGALEAAKMEVWGVEE